MRAVGQLAARFLLPQCNFAQALPVARSPETMTS
jgi:hypothetical protein